MAAPLLRPDGLATAHDAELHPKPPLATAPAPPSGLRFVLAFQLALVLGAGLPLVIRAGSPEPATDFGVWLAWSLCVIAAIRLAILALDGSMRVLSLSFWVFVYVWFGAAPLAQFGFGLFPHRGNYTRTEIVTVFAIIALGLVCYEVGKRIPPALGPALPLVRSWGLRRVSQQRIVLVAVLATVGSIVIAYHFGGTDLFFSPQKRAIETLLSAVGEQHTERLHLVSRALQVPPFLGLYLVTWLVVSRKRELAAPQRRFLLLLCGILVLLNLLVSNPVNSPRYWIGNIVLSLGLVIVPWNPRWSFLLWSTALTGAMLLVFPYADLFRYEIDLAQFDFRGLEPVAEKADYDAFQQALNAVAYVDEKGLTWGRQLSGALLFWIPRAWWAAKPLPSGELVAEFSSYTYTNLAMPLWGEAYLDGGFLAVALVFLVLGRVSESLERAFLARDRRGTLFHLLLPMVAGYQIFLLRGALMVAVAYLTPMILGLVVVTVREDRAGPHADAP